MPLDEKILEEILERHNPIWTYPPLKWEQGLLLGNGTMGVMVWGSGDLFCLTIDNNQFWDRSSWKPSDSENFKWRKFKQIIESGKVAEEEKAFQNPGTVRPTRIPPSRMEILFGNKKVKFKSLELDLYDAVMYGELEIEGKEIKLRGFIYPEEDILVLELLGNIHPEFKFRFFSDIENTPIDLDSKVWRSYTFREWIARYPKFEYSKENDIEVWSQLVPDGGGLAYGIKVEAKKGKTALYISTAYDRNNKNAKEKATKIIQKYSSQNIDAVFNSHREIWHKYYNASFISIPDTRLEALYWMEIYKLRSCTRKDGIPISLHGPWSPDGKMPPWGGDYHHNINVQMSYWPVYVSNHLDLGFSLYNFIKDARPNFREFCRQFFEREGEFVPHATDIDGNPVYDWASGQFEFNGGPWLAHHLWLHWLYSQDKEFLKEYAYPFMKEVARPLIEELKEGDDGFLHFPYSFSPEYSGFTRNFWGPDTTCDLAFIRWLLKSLLEASEMLKIDDKEKIIWRNTLEKLAPYPVVNLPWGKCLSVRKDLPLQTSHRHHSHLIPIHPLHLLTIEGSEEERELINNSIRQLIFMGHGEWVGFSFSWAASIFAHTGYPELARTMLLDYTDRMITENTFMMQGPQRGCDMSVHGTYALTLEGGFGAANAILEMLIQSYGGIVRLFPGVPECWQDVVFHNLRAEGAYLVSAIRKEGRCVFARVFAEKGGKVRIKGDFRVERVVVTSNDYRVIEKKNIEDIVLKLKEGEEIFIFPEDIIPSEVKFEIPPSKPWEFHFFGVKDKITPFPR
jgi:alpha-L-fucosidase 2